MLMSDGRRNELMEEVRKHSFDVAELCVSAARYPRISLEGLARAQQSLLKAMQAASEFYAE